VRTFDGPAFGPADIKSFDGPAWTVQSDAERR
jgi:hypothetical protein